MKYAIIFVAILLSGCAGKPDPITDINDNIQQGVSELADYANNNMDMDADKKLLLEGAKNCAAKAETLTKACQAQISQCQSEVSKAKTQRNALALVLIVLAGLFIARSLKKII